MQRAIGYARVSEDPRAVSITDQERVIRHLAETEGLDLVRVVSDEERAGPEGTGTRLSQVIAALDPDMALVVPGLETLSDDLYRQELVLRDIRERGAILMSCRKDEAEYLGDDAGSLARDLKLP